MTAESGHCYGSGKDLLHGRKRPVANLGSKRRSNSKMKAQSMRVSTSRKVVELFGKQYVVGHRHFHFYPFGPFRCKNRTLVASFPRIFAKMEHKNYALNL